MARARAPACQKYLEMEGELLAGLRFKNCTVARATIYPNIDQGFISSVAGAFSFPSLLLSSLELSNTQVYDPEIRARLGTGATKQRPGVRLTHGFRSRLHLAIRADFKRGTSYNLAIP